MKKTFSPNEYEFLDGGGVRVRNRYYTKAEYDVAWLDLSMLFTEMGVNMLFNVLEGELSGEALAKLEVARQACCDGMAEVMNNNTGVKGNA